MAPLVLAMAVAVTSLVAGARGCAFPLEGCAPAVCNGHKLSAFSALLDPEAFSANETSVSHDFSRVPRSLGYYFGKYNPLYNKGKYDKSLRARRDGAPSLNYFEFRNKLGRFKGSMALSACCNACRKSAGCSLWLFNPYINTDEESGAATFADSGDCYFLLQNDQGTGKLWTYDKVNALCANPDASFEDSTVKPYFYSGTCNSAVTDDPHFVGARGTRFDFNGDLDKSFCLLTDTRLQVNALLRGYLAPGAGEKGMRSWMKEIGVVWVDASGAKHALRLAARAGKEQQRGDGFLAEAEVDGKPLKIPAQAGSSVVQGDVTLTLEGMGKAGVFDVDNFQLRVADLLDLHLALRVAHPKLQTPSDAEVHFNLVFDGLHVSEHVHGVLGQTYRPTPAQEAKSLKFSMLSNILGAPVQADATSGRGFLDGDTHDYQTSSVLAADCKFSSLSA